jgi:hypothetical protein
MFEHRIENDQELAHAGREGHFLGLPGSTEALVEGANHGIEAGGDNRVHVQHGSHVSPATPHRALASPRAAVAIEGRDADQRGNLFMGQRAQFWQMGQEGGGQHRAHAGHAPQPLLFLPPHWTALNGLRQIRIRMRQFPFEPRDVRPQTFPNRARSGEQPVLLSRRISTNCRRRAHTAARARASASGNGRGVGRITSAKWARISASKRSVFAR